MDGPPRSTLRAALAHRDLRFLLAGLAVSTAGDWIYGVALVVLVYEETGSAGWVAAAGILRLLPFALFGVAAGALADRYDRRRVMIGSDLVRAVLMLGLAAAAWLGTPVVVALIAAFLATAAGTPYGPAMAAVTPSIVPEDDLAAANAALSTVDNAALVIGPAIGGVLILLGSTYMAFIANAITFLVSGVATAAIGKAGWRPKDDRPESIAQQLRSGITAVVSRADVSTLVLLYTAASFVYGTEIVFLVLVAERQLGIGSEGVGFLQAAVGVGGLAAAGLTGRLARSDQPLRPLAVAALGFGLPLSALAFLTWLPAALAILMVSGASVIVIDVLAATLMQRSIPQDVLARAFGLLDSVGVVAIIVGSSVTPALITMLGLEATLVAIGLFMPVVTIAMVGRLRRLETAPVEPEVAERMDLFARVDLFRGVPSQALEGLARSARPLAVAAGEAVVRHGETADRFYVVVDGTLEVFVPRGEGAEPTRILGPGDYFGEIGLVEQIPRTATVRTRDRCTLYEIAGDDFLSFVNRAPTVSATLLDVITKRLVFAQPRPRPSTAE